MRAGMQVAGSAIDRVFHPPIAPARRFGGVIDTALTLAMGSVCAFGLTLGPAPLNTVGVSSAAAAAFSGSAQAPPPSLRTTSAAAAISIVESYRLAAGLGEFVPAGTCEEAGVPATVAVTALSTLSPELVKETLLPDPAYATVSGKPGDVSVTIHGCR